MNKAAICHIISIIVNRVESLHKIGFCHGNINPSAIYLSTGDKIQVSLADFQYSKQLNKVYKSNMEGTKSHQVKKF
jgi:serine/threonine protein kinase